MDGSAGRVVEVGAALVHGQFNPLQQLRVVNQVCQQRLADRGLLAGLQLVDPQSPGIIQRNHVSLGIVNRDDPQQRPVLPDPFPAFCPGIQDPGAVFAGQCRDTGPRLAPGEVHGPLGGRNPFRVGDLLEFGGFPGPGGQQCAVGAPENYPCSGGDTALGLWAIGFAVRHRFSCLIHVADARDLAVAIGPADQGPLPEGREQCLVLFELDTENLLEVPVGQFLVIQHGRLAGLGEEDPGAAGG